MDRRDARLSGRFLEALSRRSQKDKLFRMRAHGLHEIRKRRALIMTAGDQDDRLVEGFHAFDGCIGIRSLGIIVVGNAIQFANKFDAVRKSSKGLQCLYDDSRVDAALMRQKSGSQTVLDILPSLQQELTCGAERNGFSPSLQHETVTGKACTFLDPVRCGEQAHMGVCFRLLFQHRRIRIVSIQKDAVRFVHIFKDPRLGCHIGLHGVVTFQMIGRDIQDDRRFRLEMGDEFQLEARNFCCDQPVLRHQLCFAGKGDPQIPCQSKGPSRVGKHAAKKRRGRGLPIRPRDGQDRRLRHAIGELDFTQNRDVPFHRPLDHDIFRWDDRGNDDGIHPVQKALRLRAEAELSPEPDELFFFFVILYLILQIRDHDMGSMTEKYMSRAKATDTGAQNKYMFQSYTSHEW